VLIDWQNQNCPLVMHIVRAKRPDARNWKGVQPRTQGARVIHTHEPMAVGHCVFPHGGLRELMFPQQGVLDPHPAGVWGGVDSCRCAGCAGRVRAGHAGTCPAHNRGGAERVLFHKLRGA
jgi:hypothetical protein